MTQKRKELCTHPHLTEENKTKISGDDKGNKYGWRKTKSGESFSSREERMSRMWRWKTWSDAADRRREKTKI